MMGTMVEIQHVKECEKGKEYLVLELYSSVCCAPHWGYRLRTCQRRTRYTVEFDGVIVSKESVSRVVLNSEENKGSIDLIKRIINLDNEINHEIDRKWKTFCFRESIPLEKLKERLEFLERFRRDLFENSYE